MQKKLTRRQALKSMLGFAGVAVLSACTAPAAPAPAQPAATAAPAAGEATAAPAAAPVATDTPVPPPTAAPKAGQTALRVFFGANPEEAAVRQTIFDTYQGAHPDILIQPEIPTQNTTQALLTEVAGGDPPDVVMAWELQYPILAEKGVYLPLEDVINADADYKTNVLPDFYESHIQMYTWKGKLYVLPEQNASVVLYYNKKLLDEAGVAYPPTDWKDTSWTWDGFVANCHKLTKTEGDQITQYGFTEAWWPPLSAVIFAYCNEGQWFDRYSDPTKVTITEPNVMAAFQWYADLWNKEKVATNPENWKVQAGYQMFAAGKVAYTLVGHWFYPEFSKPEHNLSMDIGVFPMGPNGKQPKTDLGGTGMALVKSAKHVNDAWEFLKFECGPDGQKIIAQSGLFAPMLKSVANSEAFLGSHKAIENVSVFNTAMENATSFPIGPAWDAMADPLGRDLDPLWNGQETAEVALGNAQTDMQQALDDSRTS